jgi:hypothetical protein
VGCAIVYYLMYKTAVWLSILATLLYYKMSI